MQQLHKNYGKKIGSIIITFILISLILFVLFPPATSVYLSPGTLSNNAITLGNTITFENVNLTIRGNERIPLTELNFSIHNNLNDNVVAYVTFSVDGTETSENPTGKFTVENTTTIQSGWYGYGYGYGYDSPDGPGYYFGYGYGYGYGGETSYSDITFLYDIVYNTHTTGTFYWKFSVNSSSTLYSNSSTTTFTVSSSGGGGGPSGPSNNPPTADADGPYTGYANNSIIFDGSASNDTDGTISNYTWDFGDDSTGFGVTPTHTYTNQGNYTVTLTVKDNGGATDTDTTSATISAEPAGDNPIAVFTAPAEAVTNETISFFGSGSYDPDGTITNYTWTFDDGTISYDENPTHAYALPDTYVITLTVTDDDGKTDTALKTISVYPGESIGIDDGYIVDEDDDGEPDAFFNASTGEMISIQKQADGTFLIDSNDDGIWDYVYNPSNGQVSVYEEPKEDDGFAWWIVAIIIIVIILAVIGILFYTGVLYIEK